MLIFVLLLVVLLLLYFYFYNQKKTSVIEYFSEDHSFPQIIYQTWKTKTKLPDNFRIWSSTWKNNHPNYKYLLWDDEDNRNFIKDNYPDFLKIYDSYDKNIKRVDAVRYFFLYHYGGIYADLDFESLKPIDPLLKEYQDYDVILGRMGTNTKFRHSIPNAIMISKPKSDFWLFVIENLRKRYRRRKVEIATGPILLKYCVEKYKGPSKIKLLPNQYLYPINWFSKKGRAHRTDIVKNNKLLDNKKACKLFPHSYAVTYWTHSW